MSDADRVEEIRRSGVIHIGCRVRVERVNGRDAFYGRVDEIGDAELRLTRDDHSMVSLVPDEWLVERRSIVVAPLTPHDPACTHVRRIPQQYLAEAYPRLMCVSCGGETWGDFA